MKSFFLILCFNVISLILSGEPTENKNEYRVLVLTDIENEPDDAQSLVRFLTYSNQWDIEGLIATTSCWQRDKIADWRILEIIEAYGKVRENLLLHEDGYPSQERLASKVKKGIPEFGMSGVGKGKDSEGSDWIIEVLEKPDKRPVWILSWGGINTLAQAMWKLEMTRTQEELDPLISKIRVYTISDQDDAGPWLRKTFPRMFYIVSPGFHENGGDAYFHATWTGISGERLYKFPSGADTSLILNPWVEDNISSHGPLGAQYPEIKYTMEGDTPTFLSLINNGLNDPENPQYGAWGGRYELYTPRTRPWFYQPETRPIWTDTEDMIWVKGQCYVSPQATIWRWRQAYQNDFAARMDWTIKPYDEANHPPIPKLAHEEVLTVHSGEAVTLDAEGSMDPDNHELKFNWMWYKEAGNCLHKISIVDANSKKASFIAPHVSHPQTIHIILSVTDLGLPALTRYKRIIINILPEGQENHERY